MFAKHVWHNSHSVCSAEIRNLNQMQVVYVCYVLIRASIIYIYSQSWSIAILCTATEFWGEFRAWPGGAFVRLQLDYLYVHANTQLILLYGCFLPTLPPLAFNLCLQFIALQESRTQITHNNTHLLVFWPTAPAHSPSQSPKRRQHHNVRGRLPHQLHFSSPFISRVLICTRV